MTSNYFLQKIGNRKQLKGFMGVFSCDKIPDPNNKITNQLGFSTLISNLSKYGEPGSHFVTIVIRRNKIIYFDPLGGKCSNHYIMRYMKKFQNEITYVSKSIQDDLSFHCGLYALGLCFALDSGCTLLQYLSKFHFDSQYLYLNDNIVTDYICKSL